MGLLRIPREIELAGLDLDYDLEDTRAAEALNDAVRDEAKKIGLL